MKKYVYYLIAFLFLGCSSDDEMTTQPVNPSPDENPVAVDDVFNATENKNFIIRGLLDNDTVIDNARIRSIEEETAQGGLVTDNRDGTYTYVPPANFTGEDNFSYMLCVPLSEDRCSSGNVVINVGDAGNPVAIDDAMETEEGTILIISSHLNNDEIIDNAELTSVDTEGAIGIVELQEDGKIKYTPAEDFSGEDSFTYTICDDDETPTCSTATITITVVDAGSPVANDDTVVVNQGGSNVVLDDLLENDDPQDDAVITSVDASASSGTVVLEEDGTVTYTASAGFTGEDSFIYSLCDDDAPEATCATATVIVRVVEPVSFNIPSGLENYYSEAVFTQDPDNLFDELADLTIDQHVNLLEYYQRHEYLYDADADLDDPDYVVLMYTGELRPDDEYQEGDLDESESFNTEHIFPQSRLSSEVAKNDMHHMRVADYEINSLRLNHPFTDGTGEAKLLGGDAWYPGDEWKGDVARMVMYIHLKYGEPFSDVGNLELFLEWNVEDPVSSFELQRQEVISGAQGNRNPFIDNPYLATLIWGGPQAENLWD